jgi:hypothetical protein
LEPGERPCRDCGVGVPDMQGPNEVMQSRARQELWKDGSVAIRDRDAEIEATRCLRCFVRRQRAEQMIESHPRVRKWLGSRVYVVALANAALCVFDALEMPFTRAEQMAETDRGFRQMLEFLPASGSRGCWASRFVPLQLLDADPTTCGVTRWSHVTERQKQAMRDAFGLLLGAVMDGEEAFPAPSDGEPACLFCGVPEVRMLRSQALAQGAWTGPFDVQTRTLGGSFRPEATHGFLCPSCAGSVEKAGGAIGAYALETALTDFVGVAMNPALEAQIVGLPAWCALPLGTQPNSKPWQHVPDLESVGDLLRSV